MNWNIHKADLPTEPWEVICPVCRIRAQPVGDGRYFHPGRAFVCRDPKSIRGPRLLPGKPAFVGDYRQYNDTVEIRELPEEWAKMVGAEADAESV